MEIHRWRTEMVVRDRYPAFRDPGQENADSEQFKAILAVEIIKNLDRAGLTVCKPQSLNGTGAGAISPGSGMPNGILNEMSTGVDIPSGPVR